MKSTKLFLMSFLLISGFSSYTPAPVLPPINNASKTATAQEVFSYIRCHRQAKNIVINWGTSTIAGIDHFVIFHSEDNDFYAPLDVAPVSSALKYTYKNENVFPGYHYYYVQAVMSVGPPINSAIDVVRIVSHG